MALLLLLTLAGVLLDALFRTQAETALREVLDAQMVALITAAEPGSDGQWLNADRSVEPRLQTPGSGLYAEIRERGGTSIWRSASTAGVFLDLSRATPRGAVEFGTLDTPRGERLAVMWRGLDWEFEEPGATGKRVSRPLVFAVATSRTPSDARLRAIRRQVLWGSVALAALLLAIVYWWLRTATRPLRVLEQELREVENGSRQALTTGLPREIDGVAQGLNLLLESERRRIARYRHNLADLAHSLKTPLAVIARAVEGDRGEASALIAAEARKMTALIERHLKRAALGGGVTLGQQPVEVAPVLAELRATLLRAYPHKDLAIEVQVAAGVRFLGDRADLLEMLGNVLDNACKWCQGRVRVSAAVAAGRVRIDIDDDGPGLPEALLAQGPARGLRADEAIPGHGLGLAMARETADSYGGALQLGRSALGGARVSLILPAGRDRPEDRSGFPARGAGRATS
ncbi:MAG: ATP-binding protein [Steroidobacteraceae bacterium]|nr:ATP-binding protein [Steroidobacteraceae bacterium]MDW8260695.1 ATP-binding protein [Gammaproteobacteria bacterium]